MGGCLLLLLGTYLRGFFLRERLYPLSACRLRGGAGGLHCQEPTPAEMPLQGLRRHFGWNRPLSNDGGQDGAVLPCHGAPETSQDLARGFSLRYPPPLISALATCQRPEARRVALLRGLYTWATMRPKGGGEGWGYRYRSGDGVKVAAVEKGGENAPGPSVHIWVCWVVSCTPSMV